MSPQTSLDNCTVPETLETPPDGFSTSQIASQTAKRIHKMFRPMEQEPLTLSEASQLQRKGVCTHNADENCSCVRSLRRNRQFRAVSDRQERRNDKLESKRGDMMGFVFDKELEREQRYIASQSEEIAKRNLELALDEEQELLEQEKKDQQDAHMVEDFMEQEQRELEALLANMDIS